MRKNSLLNASFLFLSFVLTFSVSCAKKETGWKGTMRTEGGVTIVENPAKPLYKNASLTLTEELSIGGKGTDEESELTMVQAFGVDSAGNIYVLDSKVGVIKVFDSIGRFVRKIGSKGQGPGEYQSPSFLQVVRDRELAVYDHKFITYSLLGEFIKENSCAKININSFPSHIDDKGFVYGFSLSITPKFVTDLFRIRPDFDSVDIISRIEGNDFREIVPAKPSLYCSAYGGENVIWGNSREYALFIDDDSGKPVKRIYKKGNPKKVSDRDKAVMKEENKSAASGGFKLIIPESFPHFQWISVDGDMRIFVATYEKGKDKRSAFFDVFDPEGRYIANVPLPGKFWLVLWKNNKLYSVEKDDEGYPVLKRYGVQWKF